MSARHGTTDRVRRVTAPAAIALVLAFAAPTGAATRVLAVGDFGVGGSTERATGAAIKTWEADHPAGLLLTLDDNDYTESPPAFRRNWHDAFGWLEAAGSGRGVRSETTTCGSTATATSSRHSTCLRPTT